MIDFFKDILGGRELIDHQNNAQEINSLLLNGKIVFIHRSEPQHSDLEFNKLEYHGNVFIIWYFNKDGTQQEGETVTTTDNCLEYLQFMKIDRFGFTFEEINNEN